MRGHKHHCRTEMILAEAECAVWICSCSLIFCDVWQLLHSADYSSLRWCLDPLHIQYCSEERGSPPVKCCSVRVLHQSKRRCCPKIIKDIRPNKTYCLSPCIFWVIWQNVDETVSVLRIVTLAWLWHRRSKVRFVHMLVKVICTCLQTYLPIAPEY